MMKRFLTVGSLAVSTLASAQQTGVASFELKPQKFRCVVLILNLGFRGAGSYVGKWKDELFFLETKMLGIGPLLLRRRAGDHSSEIYAPSKITSQCESIDMEVERVEKKFPHAVASLVPVEPREVMSVKIALLPTESEFGQNDLRVKIQGALGPVEFTMRRADTFKRQSGQLDVNSGELEFLSREFCQIVNGNGMYADRVADCVLSTKGQ